MAGIGGVVVQFRAEADKAIRETRKFARELGDVDNKAKKAGKGLRIGLAAGAAAATGAAVGLVSVLSDAMERVLEEDALVANLTRTLKDYTSATDDSAKAIADQTLAMEFQSSFSADELVPALGRLVTLTKDVTKAQELLALASDIAARTGKPLASAVEAIVKAQNGQTRSLALLVPGLDAAKVKSEGLAAVLPELTTQFEGADAAANDTAAEGLEDLRQAFEGISEELVRAFLPKIQEAADFLRSPEGQAALQEWTTRAQELGTSLASLAEDASDAMKALAPLLDLINLYNKTPNALKGVLGLPDLARGVQSDAQNRPSTGRGGVSPTPRTRTQPQVVVNIDQRGQREKIEDSAALAIRLARRTGGYQ